MNRSIRRLGIALVLCYLALFVQLNLTQVLRADEYNEHPENTRRIQRLFNRPRGDIVTADGALLATTVEVEGQEFDRERRYPEGDLFGHTTGYFSFLFGSAGLERSYDAELAGDTFEQQVRGLTDLFVARDNVGSLRLSLRKDLQQVARDALGEREGSVVAIDPRTGELLAFWSYPSYDPALLSSLDFDLARTSWDALNAAPGKPLLAHQYQEVYFPGSTFKVVTGGNGLAQGVVTADEPVYPTLRAWTPPLTTQPIQNFGGSACGGDLIQILEVSCNTAFAQMGTETIGPEGMIAGSEAWGFNDAPPIDLPDPAASRFPTDFTQDLPKLAQASIGQNDVAATPLQIALDSAAVANGGQMLRPTVVREVVDSDGDVIDSTEPDVWKTPLDPGSAATLKQAMINVVEGPRGTASVLRIPGYEVGGKTGTAQLGTDPPMSHTWITGFAGPPGDPQIAVAVVVLNQSGARESTGGRVAGPIAKAVLEAGLAINAAEGVSRPPLEEPGSGGPGGQAPAGPTTTASSGDGGGAPSSTAPSTTVGPAPPSTSTTVPPPSTASTSSSSTSSSSLPP